MVAEALEPKFLNEEGKYLFPSRNAKDGRTQIQNPDTKRWTYTDTVAGKELLNRQTDKSGNLMPGVRVIKRIPPAVAQGIFSPKIYR